MGIYDRPYYQDDEQRGIFLGGGGGGGGPQMMVTKIVLVNVGIFIVDALFLKGQIGDFCAARIGRAVDGANLSTLTHPLTWWRFLAYGFVHDPNSIGHVGFNMFGLWMFGREVEMKYGRQEFLRLYLTMIIFSGVVWSVYETAMLGRTQGPGMVQVIGASGAVVGMILLFALNFPKRTVLLFFVIPIPAWVLGAIIVIGDLMGAGRPDGTRVAHAAHLAGLAFAAGYFFLHWNLSWLTPSWLARFKPARGPKLKIHDPEAKKRELGLQVDEILAKISREGEASLTRRERQTLQKASREYQDKNKS